MKYKNFEFEAKVFHDFVYNKAAYYDHLGVLITNWATYACTNPSFESKYNSWIMECASTGRLSPSEYSKETSMYNVLCKEWEGYSGEYKKGIIPKLLEFYLRKADPPIIPNNDEY